MHLFPCLWVKLVTNTQAAYELLFILYRANLGLPPPRPLSIPKYQDVCLYSNSSSDVLKYMREIKGFLEYHGFIFSMFCGCKFI